MLGNQPHRRRFESRLLAMLLAIVAGIGLASEPRALAVSPAATSEAVRQAAELTDPVDFQRTVDFQREVRPILSQNCLLCHGPDESTREADLRLDLSGDATKDRGQSTAIVPGDAAASELIRRIVSTDATERMPPPETGKKLSQAQLATLRRWIEQGAEYEEHWAFVAPRQAEVPAVKQIGWPRNKIDRFILAELERQGLAPSPEADRYTLVRRVYLNLVGLPPTPDEADEFMADSRPDAYERLVDHLLASPHYGERWARPWLDLARYSDTKGYEKDQPRTMWVYRDWVIDALNRDLPFDEFTIEQLAGDMLPNSTLAQKVATGFHRNTMTNEEGGIDPQEFRFQALVDRVATTGATWLGLTTGCAQCHTHKYDPITHEDYYALFALLNNANEIQIDAPTPATLAQQARVEAKLNRLQASLADQFPVPDEIARKHRDDSAALRAARSAVIDDRLDLWISEQVPRVRRWQSPTPISVEADVPTTEVLDDGSVLVSGDVTKNDRFIVRLPVGERPVTAIRLEALPHASLPGGGPGRQEILDDHNQGRGNFLLTEIKARLITKTGDPSLELSWGAASESYAPPGITAAMAIDGKHDTGWSTYGRLGERHTAVFQLEQPLTAPAGSLLEIELQCENFYPASLGRFRLSTSTAASAQATELSPEIEEALLADAGRTDFQRQMLREYFLSVAPELAPQQQRIAELKGALPRHPTALVMQERAKYPRVTHRHHRGEYLQGREVVAPQTPSCLPPLAEGEPPNRLTFARWLVSPDNPLTARVTVNRQWQAIFGRGLVRTAEDFGYQGEYPTHPELLDWLAVEFLERGWSLKQLHRLIVTSATYRQASATTPELLRRDPENKLLARGPRVRLEAELVRDVVLSAAGQLSPKIGGPSVYPPQPAGVTDAAYVPMPWVTSQGEDRYRRGLYTFNKRTAPYAAFSLYDAPSGEACIPRRNSSNTPLQALALMNDTVVLEAARALALEADEPGCSEAEVATEMFRRCVVRPPEPEELAAILEFYHTQSVSLTGSNPLLVLNAGPKLSWRFDKGQEEWQAAQDCVLAYQDGRVIATSLGADPILRAKLDFPAGPVTLTLRARFTNLEPCEVFWTTTAESHESIERSARFNVTTTEMVAYELVFTAAQPLRSLRIDPGSSPGRVEIESLQLAYGDGLVEVPLSEGNRSLAAWMLVARSLLNLDETITKP